MYLRYRVENLGVRILGRIISHLWTNIVCRVKAVLVPPNKTLKLASKGVKFSQITLSYKKNDFKKYSAETRSSIL